MSGLTKDNRDYWICQLAGWGTLTVFELVGSSSGNSGAALRFALAKIVVSGTGMLLSHVWRGHLRRQAWIDRASELPLKRLAGGLLLLALAQCGCLLLADVAFHHGAFFESGPGESLLFNLVLLVLLWYVVFAFWTACYAVALSRRRAERFQLEKLRLEVDVKEAELRALQAQVNPHFFFNSLSSIRSLVYEDTEAAAHAIHQLAGLMRRSLRSNLAPTARLDDELAAVRAYLDMEKLRFEERLQPELDVPAELGAEPLPPMMLQTLVENAVRHGVERTTGPCCIRISARREIGGVRLLVANQGRLVVDSESTRVGLANASRRLALQFGATATCSLAENAGWVIATVWMPRETTA